MASPGALERPHVRLQLIKQLAAGDQTRAALARLHGVSGEAIRQFADRHAPRITELQGKLDDEFAGLWVADKANRLAHYQQQIEDVAAILEAEPEIDEGKASRGAGVNVSTAELMRVQASALRAIADELGQIPARMQVEHSGSLAIQINGVDLDALR